MNNMFARIITIIPIIKYWLFFFKRLNSFSGDFCTPETAPSYSIYTYSPFSIDSINFKTFSISLAWLSAFSFI